MFRQKVGDVHHLVLVGLGGCHGGDGTVVVVVHYYDGVETLEVILLKLAGVTVEVVAMLYATLPHAAVGQLTYMPIAYARRVDFKLVAESRFLHEALHDAFACWRAADVAEADE